MPAQPATARTGKHGRHAVSILLFRQPPRISLLSALRYASDRGPRRPAAATDLRPVRVHSVSESAAGRHRNPFARGQDTTGPAHDRAAGRLLDLSRWLRGAG